MRLSLLSLTLYPPLLLSFPPSISWLSLPLFASSHAVQAAFFPPPATCSFSSFPLSSLLSPLFAFFSLSRLFLFCLVSPGSCSDRVYWPQFASVICLHTGTEVRGKEREDRNAGKRRNDPCLPSQTHTQAQTPCIITTTESCNPCCTCHHFSHTHKCYIKVIFNHTHRHTHTGGKKGPSSG